MFSLARLGTKLLHSRVKDGFSSNRPPGSLPPLTITAGAQLSSHPHTGDDGRVQPWRFAALLSSRFLPSARWSWHRWRPEPGRAACQRRGCMGDEGQRGTAAEGTCPSWPRLRCVGGLEEKQQFTNSVLSVREKIRYSE